MKPGTAPPAGLPDGTRVAVTRGQASRAEVAAIVAALDATTPAGGVRAVPPAWLRAARVEGLGRRQVAAPSDFGEPA